MSQAESTFRFSQGTISVPAGQAFTCQYIQIPFEVPAGTGEIRLALSYKPARVAGVSNLITLGLFDPQGFRGNAHRQPPDKHVVIRPELASPGFVAGPLPAGKWLAQLAAHAILPDAEPCQYSLDIEMIPAAGETQTAAGWTPARGVLSGEAKWYRGELHSHTQHSDGSHTPAELLELARKRGLDFLTISDHNTHSAFKALEKLDPKGLLVIPGIELTTFYGHALLLGVEGWIDWRSGYNGWTMEDAARAIHAAGGLFILAHPNDIGSPFCTGCRWEYDFDMSLADGVEVWNGNWEQGSSKNPGGLELWQRLQAGGQRLLATAGSDFHSAFDWGAGSPCVYVYARELSTPGVLEGLRQGHVILSSGPWLNLTVQGGQGEPFRVGDTCTVGARPLQLELEWADVPADARLLVRSAQDVLETLPVSGSGSVRHRLAVQGEQRFWGELYAADGSLLALTNPLYARQEE